MVVAVVVLPNQKAASVFAANDASWVESFAHVYEEVGIVEMSSHTFSIFHILPPVCSASLQLLHLNSPCPVDLHIKVHIASLVFFSIPACIAVLANRVEGTI